MTELSIPGTVNRIKNEEINLLGYSLKPVIQSHILSLDGQVCIEFELKIKDNIVENPAIIDIDFFTSQDNDTFIKETAMSYASMVVIENNVCLLRKDFNRKFIKIFEIKESDDEWHNVKITINRENLWCPNKKCQFEDCSHDDAEILSDEYTEWSESRLKRHVRIGIEFDNLETIYINYMSGTENFKLSFGNNNMNSKNRSRIYNRLVSADKVGEYPVSIKNLHSKYKEEEIDLFLK